jgi:hypothetical protein
MASIKCGKCKSTHGSVAEVRGCYQAPAKSTTVWAKTNMTRSTKSDAQWKQEFADREAEQERAAYSSKMTATMERPITGARATSKQAWFIVKLLGERAELSGSPIAWSQDEMAAQQMEQSITEASAVIDRLKDEIATLKEGKAHDVIVKDSKPPTVPAGRYAIEREGTLKFYRVTRPEEGRWAGWTFVDRQASDERYPVKNRIERESILRQIGEDVQGAMETYGRELGHCGHCGRTLTNEVSRERGIGPVCAEKMGW